MAGDNLAHEILGHGVGKEQEEENLIAPSPTLFFVEDTECHGNGQNGVMLIDNVISNNEKQDNLNVQVRIENSLTPILKKMFRLLMLNLEASMVMTCCPVFLESLFKVLLDPRIGLFETKSVSPDLLIYFLPSQMESISQEVWAARCDARPD